MSRYKKIEYVKCIGCHHDENDELTGGQEIPMVAMFDSERISEMSVQECIQLDQETPYLMLITKTQYDNNLKPAVDEVMREAHAEYAAAMCNTE